MDARRARTPAQRQFLAALPLTLTDEDRLYVHAEASNPASWTYVTSTRRGVAQHQRHLRADQLLRPYPPAGDLQHVADRKDDGVHADHRRPRALLPGRRWLAVLGSVGQPRDGNPAAAYRHVGYRQARNHLLPRAL